MITARKLASAVGGKTARACDSCIKKRARWYCAADDAFLCQVCDSSVHSANLLARRHERVRLKTASTDQSSDEPSWHHGFKRKPRTPRKSNKSHARQANPTRLVPELGREENLFEESDEQQLLYQVPVFDSFTAQLCVSGTPGGGKKRNRIDEGNKDGKYLSGTVNYDCGDDKKVTSTLRDFNDLEFAADVENLLAEGINGESFHMETLGFLDCGQKDLVENSRSSRTVRQDYENIDADAVMGNAEIDITAGEAFELNFDDYDSPGDCKEDDKARVKDGTSLNLENEDSGVGNVDYVKQKKSILLALNYEGVIAAWADQKSPWIDGGRPEIDPNDCWSNCMDICGGIHYETYGEIGGSNIRTGMFNGGREARVLRYREKRRTRLFSKKIRYEVRKLNAEKRPRVKGRFVKTGKSGC